MNFRKYVFLLLMVALAIQPVVPSFAETDPFPGVAYGSEIPGTRIQSSPGVTQSQWEATETFKNWSCPEFSGRAGGVDLNFTTTNSDDIWFNYCVKQWQPQVTVDAWAKYRSDLAAAQSAAEAESRAWNAANPGKQKCVQWGPITDPNGGTSSGGVCANPVEPGPNTTVQSQAADSVVGPSGTTAGETSTSVSPSATGSSGTSSSTTSTTSTSTNTIPVGSTVNPNVPGSGAPFTRVLSGQLSSAECPSGFQGANGIIVAIGIGTFTECWPKNAWDAWRMGGVYWDLYKSSGGTYDIQAVITRLNEIASFKAQAKSIAQRAADLTPGIQRCSNWSAYGESGQECAYTFIAPSGTSGNSGFTASDSSTVKSNSDTSTISSAASSASSTNTTVSETSSGKPTSSTDSSTATTSRALSLASATVGNQSISNPTVVLQTVSVTDSISKIKELVEKIEPSKKEVKAINSLMTNLETVKVVTRSQTTVNLPKSPTVEESAKSLTPEVCSVTGLSVNSLKKGMCKVEYTVVDSLGNSYTTTKDFEFKK